MSDEDLMTDEDLEETAVDGEEPEDDEEDTDDSDDILDSDNATYAAPKSKKKVDDLDAIDDFSIASRQKMREELDAQVAEFLARGGRISEIEPNVTADPPKKPTSDYGGRPI